jgi:hypothetical protein
MEGTFKYFGVAELNKDKICELLKELPIIPLVENKQKSNKRTINLGELVFNVKPFNAEAEANDDNKDYFIIPVRHKDVKVVGYHGYALRFAFHELAGLGVGYKDHTFRLIINKK